MPKAKVLEHATPSQEIIQQQNHEFVVTDKRGRKITLKKPSMLMQYKLVEILGESAKNDTYVAMVTPLLFVIDIDSLPVHRVNDKRQIDALIDRLDEEGIEAVMQGITTHFSDNRSVEEFKESVKK